jgi:putative ATP-binding cassette transporter
MRDGKMAHPPRRPPNGEQGTPGMPSVPPLPTATTAKPRPDFFRQFVRLAGPYWTTERGLRAQLLTAALVVLTVAQVGLPVAINFWSEKLFDSLEQRAMGEFLYWIGALVLIIGANIVVVSTHLVVKRRLQVDWRAWVTRRVLDEWMASGRHYQLGFLPGEHDNPDGRIAEDIRIATEYAIDLAHSLCYSLLLLFSFIHILWRLSGPPEVPLDGFTLYLPGHLVWIALLYATAGTALGMLLGRPLVRAANHRQTQEQTFRFGLVHARENAVAIALRHGEEAERESLWGLFRDAICAWDRQTNALRNLFLFSSGWSVLSQAFPILVSAPRYIAGTISLGVLMQTAQAFQQTMAALSWPIDNLPKVAEWRASVGRVLGLHDAVSELAEQTATPERPPLIVAKANRPVLALEEVAIARPDGELLVDCFSTEIRPGERVLITGDPEAAMTLFRVVAGLWPWGHGRVELPEGVSIYFMPRVPRLTPATLRAMVSYPPTAYRIEDRAIQDALRRVGLDYLIARLDETGDWAELLDMAEKQRLGFARLFVHQPEWIFIHEATDALDLRGRRDMMQMLDESFPGATVVTIGHDGALEAFHHRRLELGREPCAPREVTQTA